MFVITTGGGVTPETPVLGFVGSSALAYRTAGNTVNIPIQISTVQTAPVSITYTLGGTATGGGSDYSVVTPSPITLNASTSLVNLSLDIEENLDADETVIITITGVSGGDGPIDLGTTVFTLTLRKLETGSTTVDQPNKAGFSGNRPVSLCTGIVPTRRSLLQPANLNGRTCDVLPFKFAPDPVGDNHLDPIVTAVELCGIALAGETDAIFSTGAGTAPASFSVCDIADLIDLKLGIDIYNVGYILVPVFDTSHPDCFLVETRKDGDFVKEKTYFSRFSKVIGGEEVYFGGLTTYVTYYSNSVEAYRVVCEYENSIYNVYSPQGHNVPHSDQAGIFAIKYAQFVTTNPNYLVCADHKDPGWNAKITTGAADRNLSGFSLVSNTGKYQPLLKKTGVPPRHFTIYKNTVSFEEAMLINNHGQFSRAYNGVFGQHLHRWYGPFDTPLPEDISDIAMGNGLTGRASVDAYCQGHLDVLKNGIINDIRNDSTEASGGLRKVRAGYCVALGSNTYYDGGRRWITQSAGEFNSYPELMYYRVTGTYCTMREAASIYTPEGKIVIEPDYIASVNNNGQVPWKLGETDAMPKNHPHFNDSTYDTNFFEGSWNLSRTNAPWNAISRTADATFFMGADSVNPLNLYSEMPSWNFAHISRYYLHFIPLSCLLNDGWARRRAIIGVAYGQFKKTVSPGIASVDEYAHQKNNMPRLISDIKNMNITIPGYAGQTGLQYLTSKGYGWNGPPTEKGVALYRDHGHWLCMMWACSLITDPIWRAFNHDVYAPKVKEFLDWYTPETGFHGGRSFYISESNTDDNIYSYDWWPAGDTANRKGRTTRLVTTAQGFHNQLLVGGIAAAERALGLSMRTAASGPSNLSSNEPDPIKRSIQVAMPLIWKVMENHVSYSPAMRPQSFIFQSYDNVVGAAQGSTQLLMNPPPTIAEYQDMGWELYQNPVEPYNRYVTTWTDKDMSGFLGYFSTFSDSGYSTLERDFMVAKVGVMYGNLSGDINSIQTSVAQSFATNIAFSSAFGFYDAECLMAAFQLVKNGL